MAALSENTSLLLVKYYSEEVVSVYEATQVKYLGDLKVPPTKNKKVVGIEWNDRERVLYWLHIDGRLYKADRKSGLPFPVDFNKDYKGN